MWKAPFIWRKGVRKQYWKGYPNYLTQGLHMFLQCLWWPFLASAMLLPTMNSRKCTNILKSVLGMWESGHARPRCEYSWTWEELRSGCPQCDAIRFLNELTTQIRTPLVPVELWMYILVGDCHEFVVLQEVLLSLDTTRIYFWLHVQTNKTS